MLRKGNMQIGAPGDALITDWEPLITTSWEYKAQQEKERKERERFEAAAKSNPVRLDVDVVYVCTRDHPSTLQGEPCLVKKGSRALADSEAVLQSPENWRPERR